MKRVIVESPYAGNVDQNVEYARRCIKDSIHRDEAPFASHLIYTQAGVLNDLIPAERTLGIEAGLAWGLHADLVVLYTDLGLSPGMIAAQRFYESHGIEVIERRLDDPAT